MSTPQQPDGPTHPPQGWPAAPAPPPRRKSRAGLIAGLVAAAIVLLCLVGGLVAIVSDTDTTTDAGDGIAAGKSPTPAKPTGAAAPDPKGEGTGSCDYELFPNKLNGEVDVENTGNIGIVVDVTISWPQYGQKPVKETKQAKVDTGETKTVRFSRKASTSEISRWQSWQERHDYEDGCGYKLKIVDTFGSVA